MTLAQFKEEVQRYLKGEHPFPFGSFVYSVLTNDLVGAFQRADDSSRRNMGEFVSFLYMDMPGRTGDPKKDWWGSEEAVNNRIKDQVLAHARKHDAY